MASGATGTYGLPYPLQTDPVDVAADIQSLATALEIQLISRANLDSPTFIGDPKAPTPSDTDNDTSIATTAFVKNQGYITSTAVATTYAPKASPTFTGTVTVPTLASTGQISSTTATSKVIIGTDAGGSLSLGRTDGVSSGPYIDFNSGTTAVDYDVRLQASGGNGTVGGGTLEISGQLLTIAPTASRAGLRLPHGTTPSSPVNGDIWTTSVGIYARINGNTVGPFGTGANWQATAPSPAISGMMWVDSTSDVLYIYNGTEWYSPQGIQFNRPPSGSYELALTDRSKLVEMSSSTGVTLSIPTNASKPFPIGTQIQVMQTGLGQVTIAATNGTTTTVNGSPGLKLRSQWSSATLIKRNTDTWVAIGDLTA